MILRTFAAFWENFLSESLITLLKIWQKHRKCHNSRTEFTLLRSSPQAYSVAGFIPDTLLAVIATTFTSSPKDEMSCIIRDAIISTSWGQGNYTKRRAAYRRFHSTLIQRTMMTRNPRMIRGVTLPGVAARLLRNRSIITVFSLDWNTDSVRVLL